MKAKSPGNRLFFTLLRLSVKIFIPLASKIENFSSSVFNISVIKGSALFNSGYESDISLINVGTILQKIGSLLPKICVCLIPRLIILLKTYPLPSLEGKTPSAIRKALARKWSAITLWLAILSLVIFVLVNSEETLIKVLK